MNYLLDTHALLWFISGDTKLPKRLKAIIENIEIPCYLSIVSLWEIVIKRQIGKLELDIELTELYGFLERNRIEVLPIEFVHLLELSNLPMFHSDPFDRIIISQSIAEKMIVLSCDEKFNDYKILLEWK